MSPATALAATREELAALLAEPRGARQRVCLVPTMGALHEGHASLMRAARSAALDGPVAVSIFVNPLQFGPTEDLDRYPRTLDADLAMCAREGVDVVFAPSAHEVYPGGEPQVTVEPGPSAAVLEGKTRPGHFRGVLTVVTKLFGLVRPDVAVFGQKDYQQLVLIRRMVADLCQDVQVIGAPTCREPDGLAMSSRNRYLDSDQRRQAGALSTALEAARRASPRGPTAVLEAAGAVLRKASGVDVDYLVLTGPDLLPLPSNLSPGTEARVLVAARVGPTRLIDNVAVFLGGPER